MTLPRAHARRAAAAALLPSALGLAGCSGGDDSADRGSAATSASALHTKVTIGKVEGRLPAKRRQQIAGQVGEVVDRWLAAAYVGGEFPRRDFSDAFPGFTRDAARDAARDPVMSNRRFGGRVDAVVPKRSRLLVDVLAVRNRAAGVTARFSLRMRLAGDVQRTERVGGRLFLTWSRGRWRVFGYDVQRGPA